jgi:hypothetical protein
MAGALAAAVLLGLVLFNAEPKLRAVAPTETATTSAPALSVAAQAAVGHAPPETPAKGKVALRIEVKPSHTRIRLDGRLLKGNPYLTTVERDSLEHELTMTAEGHRAATRKLRFDDDVDMEISLVPLDDEPRAASARGEHAPARNPNPPAAEKAPSAIDRVEPGMDLAPSVDRRARRKIDERDPYDR